MTDQTLESSFGDNSGINSLFCKVEDWKSCLPKSKVRQASKTPAWFQIRENTTLHTVILQPAEVPAGLCAVLYLRTLSIKDVLMTTSSLQLHTHSRGLESGSFASSGRSGSP